MENLRSSPQLEPKRRLEVSRSHGGGSLRAYRAFEVQHLGGVMVDIPNPWISPGYMGNNPWIYGKWDGNGMWKWDVVHSIGWHTQSLGIIRDHWGIRLSSWDIGDDVIHPLLQRIHGSVQKKEGYPQALTYSTRPHDWIQWVPQGLVWTIMGSVGFYFITVAEICIHWDVKSGQTSNRPWPASLLTLTLIGSQDMLWSLSPAPCGHHTLHRLDS